LEVHSVFYDLLPHKYIFNSFFIKSIIKPHKKTTFKIFLKFFKHLYFSGHSQPAVLRCVYGERANQKFGRLAKKALHQAHSQNSTSKARSWRQKYPPSTVRRIFTIYPKNNKFLAIHGTYTIFTSLMLFQFVEKIRINQPRGMSEKMAVNGIRIHARTNQRRTLVSRSRQSLNAGRL